MGVRRKGFFAIDLGIYMKLMQVIRNISPQVLKG